MLFLKRLSDEFDDAWQEVAPVYAYLSPDEIEFFKEKPDTYGGRFFVPKVARWENLKDEKKDVGNKIDAALTAIEHANPTLNGIFRNTSFNKTSAGKPVLSNETLINLLVHFNNEKYKLTNDNFEFPDLLGAAYEYLIKDFADTAGKKGGEFYTPSEVVRLMVRLETAKGDVCSRFGRNVDSILSIYGRTRARHLKLVYIWARVKSCGVVYLQNEYDSAQYPQCQY